MSIFKCSCKKKGSTEVRYLETAYDALLFCSDFSKIVDTFPASDSYKEQLRALYETNIEILENSQLHERLREFLTETDKAKFDEILARPRPKLEFND